MRSAIRLLACAVGLWAALSAPAVAGPANGQLAAVVDDRLVALNPDGSALRPLPVNEPADHRARVVAGRQPARDRARRADLGLRVRHRAARRRDRRDLRREPGLVRGRHADRVQARPGDVHGRVRRRGGPAAARARPAARAADDPDRVAPGPERRDGRGRRAARAPGRAGRGRGSGLRAGREPDRVRQRPRAVDDPRRGRRADRGRARARGVAALGAGRVGARLHGGRRAADGHARRRAADGAARGRHRGRLAAVHRGRDGDLPVGPAAAVQRADRDRVDRVRRARRAAGAAVQRPVGAPALDPGDQGAGARHARRLALHARGRLLRAGRADLPREQRRVGVRADPGLDPRHTPARRGAAAGRPPRRRRWRRRRS